MSKYTIQSNNTKILLSETLKKLMSEKNLKKISINEIVGRCNLNRNSFYYHFNDIYDLLKFTLDREAVNIIKETNLGKDIKGAILFITNYIDKNKAFCQSAYNSLGREELKLFLKNDIQIIISNYITDILNTNNITVNDEFKNYIISVHSDLIATNLIYYLNEEFNIEKENLINYMIILFTNSLDGTINLIINNKI